MYIIVILSRIL